MELELVVEEEGAASVKGKNTKALYIFKLLFTKFRKYPDIRGWSRKETELKRHKVHLNLLAQQRINIYVAFKQGTFLTQDKSTKVKKTP